MLPLGGLFLGIELIPLFPPLRAVMLKKKGRSSVGFLDTDLGPIGLPGSGLPRPGNVVSF